MVSNQLPFIKRLLWKPRHALARNTKLQKLRQLQALQWIDQDASDDFQKARLQDLLLHAHRFVPYYREVFAKIGIIQDNSSVNLQAFSRIPLLDKTIIRKRLSDLLSHDLDSRRWYYNTSGGSTGEPVRFIQDNEYFDWESALKMLYDSWTGYFPAAPKVLLWGSERDIFFGKEQLRTRLRRWLNNEIWLNTFRITPEQMHTYVHTINSFRPSQIQAYVESIYGLSEFIGRKRLYVHSPRAIMTSAGTLHSHVRQTIEAAFQAPVFDRYGSREVGDMACECPHHSGLHVAAPTHYVEILKRDGSPTEPGKVGEIVVTVLINHAMPLIRYRIGDMGAWTGEACTCGRSWPLLAKVTGRVTDTFLTRNGTHIHGEYFTHLFYLKDWVEKFQVIQQDYDHITILIVPREQHAKLIQDTAQLGTQLQDMTSNIRVVMGTDCTVDYDFVNDIPTTPSGKYRYTISKIFD